MWVRGDGLLAPDECDQNAANDTQQRKLAKRHSLGANWRGIYMSRGMSKSLAFSAPDNKVYFTAAAAQKSYRRRCRTRNGAVTYRT